MIRLQGCYHKFCKECLAAYLSFEVTEGRVLTIRCPGRGENDLEPCRKEIPRKTLAQLLDGDMMDRYERLNKLQRDENMRACPRCKHVQKNKNFSSNAMTCEKCATEYCFEHELAHPTMSCQEFSKKQKEQQKEEDRDSLAFIRSQCVYCPHCSSPVIKSDGCNHMTCSKCNTGFCWLCGGRYMGGLHFARFNILGCPGMQHTNMGGNSRKSFLRDAARTIFLPPLILTVIALFIAGAISAFALWCVWFFGLLPIWIPLYYKVKRDTALHNPNFDHFSRSEVYRKKRKMYKLMFWGIWPLVNRYATLY